MFPTPAAGLQGVVQFVADQSIELLESIINTPEHYKYL
jgi:hypothetical protein